MQIILTKQPATQVKSGFYVEIEYEHGDADLTTKGSAFFATETEFLSFYSEFHAAAQSIFDCRSSGNGLPRRYYSDMADKGIELEYDAVYRNAPNYFANMHISKIEYRNNGEKFNVEVLP